MTNNLCRFCGNDLTKPDGLLVYTTVRYYSKTVEKNPYPEDPDIGLDLRITLERDEEDFDYVACGNCGEMISDETEGIEFVWPKK